MKFKVTISVFLILCSIFTFGQNNSGSKIDSLKKVLSNTHDVSKRVKLELSLARLYLKIDYQQSKKYALSGLNFSQKAQIEDFQGELYAILGDIAVMQDSLTLAADFYNKAYKIFELNDNKGNLSSLSRVLGNIAYVQADFSQAMLYYKQAIELANGTSEKEFLDDIYTNIGVLNMEAGNIKEAQKYLAIALEAANKNNDSTLMAIILLNFGQLYLDINDTIIANKYLNEAYHLYQKYGTSSDLSMVYRCFGKLERLKRNYPAAINYLEKGVKYGLQEDLNYLGPKNIILTDLYLELGLNYQALKAYDSSKKYFREALQLGLINRELKVIANSAKGLSEIWYQENAIDSAYFYLKIYKEFSDSLLNDENIRKLANLDANFKYEQLVAANEQQRIAETEKHRRNLLIMIFVIVGLVLTIIILFLFLKLGRNKIEKAELQKNNLEKELELRNKELTTHVIYQLKNNEFVVSISNKLKNLLVQLQPGNRKIIEDIIREISTDSGKSTWKEFEVRFQQVHNDFYKNLSNKYPDLTSNELRLAAFLKLNMNTKEISAITFQSTNSIDVGRSRLRQKLGLAKDENLSAFLSQF